ncbi:MAG: hypothetical protein ACRC9X_05170 [Bacteroidales bacterium]
MKLLNKTEQLRVQLVVAIILALGGLFLMYAGFLVAPTGEIHNSVLVAYGELATFAGALFGIDYKYRFNITSKKEQNDGTDN